MFLGLIMGFPVVIVALGAFKLGTRLENEKEKRVSNDYFLVGNLVSLLIVFIQVYRTLLVWFA